MAFQVHFDKEEISFSQQKDLIHVKKNNANLWMTSFLKELKNSFNDVQLFFKIFTLGQ